VLRITVDESDAAIAMTLEGRIAGPWVTELSDAWFQLAPKLGTRALSVDLCNVTYADAGGKQVLRNMYEHGNAKLVTNNLWAQYIADEIINGSNKKEEHGHGNA